jgi:hypothetical protein
MRQFLPFKKKVFFLAPSNMDMQQCQSYYMEPISVSDPKQNEENTKTSHKQKQESNPRPLEYNREVITAAVFREL